MPATPTSGSQPPAPPQPIGGPIYRLYHRYVPGRTSLADARYRILAAAALAWLPLAVLSHFGAGGGGVPFLLDLEVHLKLLVALPILAGADVLAQPRLASATQQFPERGLVLAADGARFAAAAERAARARDSRALEIVVLAVVYTLGHWLWRVEIALGTATWYAVPSGSGSALTLAGAWYAFVSAPLFRFLLFLWYARLVLWFRFLWTVARLDLQLSPAHPDRAGGLGFVGNSLYAFAPLLAAQGVLLAGMIGGRIFHEGRNLADFRLEIVGLVGFALGVLLGPLLVFSPPLAHARRLGLRRYGALASRYVREFDDKWVCAAPPANEPLVGTPDLQSLADLDGGFQVVHQMRVVPFGTATVYRLAFAVVVPLLPLLLTAFPVEELLDRLVKMML